jgi:hypothetical protein
MLYLTKMQNFSLSNLKDFCHFCESLNAKVFHV